MGNLTLLGRLCVQALSQGSDTARKRMPVKLRINFFWLLLLLFITFPAGLRSVFQDDYKEPKSPFLPSLPRKQLFKALTLWPEGAQGGLWTPVLMWQRPQAALQLLWTPLSWLHGSTFQGLILAPPRHVDSQSGTLNQSNKRLLIAYHVQPKSHD